MAEVFVSYKGEDAKLASVLVRILRAAGLTVWWDGELQYRDNWKASVVKEIYSAKVLLGVWTARAVSPDGLFIAGVGGIPYVESEHTRAGIEKVLGLLFDPDAVPFGYESRQFCDLTEWSLEDTRHPEITKLVSHLIQVCTPEHSRRRILDLELQLESTRKLETAEAANQVLKQQMEEMRGRNLPNFRSGPGSAGS